MKLRFARLALFVCFSFFSFASFAANIGVPSQGVPYDSIHFRDASLGEALKMAKADKKPVFFMGYASWCEHCARMKEKIFKDPAVAAYFNEHFVCIKQDLEKGDGPALKAKFQIKEYPAFVFLEGDTITLYQSIGEKNDSAMIEQGKIALTPEKQYPYLKKQFEKDVSNADNCLAYVFALRAAMLDCSEPAKKYLATQSEQQLLSPVNWKIIANGIRDINSREIQFVLSHQKEYAAIASPLRVERKLVNLADELLTPYVNVKDSAGYFSRRPQAVSMHYYKVDSLVFKNDLSIYAQLHNWNEYKNVANKSVETKAWNNGSLLKEIANNYSAHVTDTTSLLLATKWIKHALELNNEYSPYVTCAKLYGKTGDKKSAIEMAQKAKDYALKYGFSHADADALILELQK